DFYLDVLRQGFFPWIYLLPFALALGVEENLRARLPSCLLLLVIALVFGLYTGAQTKVPWYIVPIYPAMAILVASMVGQAFQSLLTISFAGLTVAACVVAMMAPLRIILVFVGAGLLFVCFCRATKRSAHKPMVGLLSVFLVILGL